MKLLFISASAFAIESSTGHAGQEVSIIMKFITTGNI